MFLYVTVILYIVIKRYFREYI